ncbi:hypothetical protein K469DRAFT_776161 [Zopfia rhizophila CBS 207.26]|uniref:Uncharacterized protein n=1 Tax=Zopfia rhizophila CBS 207.26 TaxID=1314779 RepID=A0A6A6E8N5_9PEZI|nr:hypothetical protein K469DRAFT_776161 [Zopfia rhizophila CBS 207.26]
MSGFASLKPAFTVQLRSTVPLQIGNVASGGSLQVVPIVWGTVKSEPGYDVALDAEVVHGADYVRIEPAQTHVSIGVNTVLKNVDGSHMSYSYKVTHVHFETGAEHLKPLEHRTFVGSAHFVIKEGEGMIIETKISQVVI